jgi:putative transcriptional regulator
MSKGVANGLRELRQRYGLTQEQLARDLDVTRHTILALEVGRYVPSIELALKLAAYFDQPLETIFWLSEEEVAATRDRARRTLPGVTSVSTVSTAEVSSSAPTSPPDAAGRSDGRNGVKA